MAVSSNEGGFTVAMTRATDPPGVDIVDPIERRRCTLLTAEPVTPVSGEPESFHFPVETAVNVDTEELRAPFTGHAYVRDESGDVVAEAANGFSDTFSAHYYVIELTGLIKVYLEFEGAFSLTNGYDGVDLSFSDVTTVSIGSRSLHRRPATTITTTTEPADLMQAVSTFGSALKTTSPERSFPTWRGHPPTLEIGESLEIPEELTPPVDDVVIEIPPTYDHIFPTTSLAYYLGVGLEIGHIPRIVGEGIDHLLTHPQGYDRAVHETLQQVFLLECITRTEGLYPVDLLERNRLEDRVTLDFADLYEAPVGERLSTYLEVPYRTIEDLVPDWRIAAHVDADTSSIPTLPYLANDLALVTMANGTTVSSHLGTPHSSTALTRGSTSEARGSASTEAQLVRPQGGPSALETAWVSEGMPVNATKAVLEAYENRIGRQPQEDSIEIAVVCNSKDMDEELQIVDEVYGSHEEMPFDVTIHEELTTSELESLVTQDFNFLHYIGHIDGDGFRCADGRLDMTDVDDVAPEAFFLNACQSYDQGLSLIEGGAIGGIVTLNDVVNHGAVRIGQMVAQLLNTGFPIRAALDLAGTRSVVGNQYIVVGDGTFSIVQPPTGTPQLYDVDVTSSGCILQMEGFGAPPGMGCMYLTYLDNNQTQYLAEGTSMRFELEEQELRDFLALDDMPIRIDDEIVWELP